MQISARQTRAITTGKPFRYAHRVLVVPDRAGNYNILIDGKQHFRLEGDIQWPAQWRLFPVVDGVRAANCVAIDNEHWDIVSQLQRGEHWMPSSDVERVPQHSERGTTYTRFPEYLPER